MILIRGQFIVDPGGGEVAWDMHSERALMILVI